MHRAQALAALPVVCYRGGDTCIERTVFSGEGPGRRLGERGVCRSPGQAPGGRYS